MTDVECLKLQAVLASWCNRIEHFNKPKTEYDDFMTHINNVWNRRPGKTDWIGYEQTNALILGSPRLTCEQKVDLLKQAIDAYTGRGYFV